MASVEKVDAELVENALSDVEDSPKIAAINQAHSAMYAEAIERYPSDEAIDGAVERKLVRKLDRRILPLLGICYFFYVSLNIHRASRTQHCQHRLICL